MKQLIYSICLLGVIVMTSHIAHAEITIVAQGKSTFSIVLPHKAPDSLHAAAEELQQDIAISTGAKLPITEDTGNVPGPVISLGATKQAHDAGITADEIPDEGFHIGGIHKGVSLLLTEDTGAY